MAEINFDDFKKIELKVATILEAEKIEGSDKLIKLQIDLGDPSASLGAGLGQRQIVAGIGLAYTPEELVGKQIIIVTNLEPKILMGFESQGMLLAATENRLPILLTLDKPASNGAGIK